MSVIYPIFHFNRYSIYHKFLSKKENIVFPIDLKQFYCFKKQFLQRIKK